MGDGKSAFAGCVRGISLNIVDMQDADSGLPRALQKIVMSLKRSYIDKMEHALYFLVGLVRRSIEFHEKPSKIFRGSSVTLQHNCFRA